MKKIILTAAAVFAFGFVNAQKTQFGLKAGVDFINRDFKIGDPKTGFYAGGFADIATSEKFHVQPEMLYVSILNLNHVKVPILAKYQIVQDLYLVAVV